MDFAEKCNRIFWNTEQMFRSNDDIDFKPVNPFDDGSAENILFERHLIETAIRLHGNEAAYSDRIKELKAECGALTEALERCLAKECNEAALVVAAIDRLSAVALDIFVTDSEVRRGDASPEYVEECRGKLRNLLGERERLTAEMTAMEEEYRKKK